MFMAIKLYPYINKFTGDVQILPKSEGSKLNEDWAMGKTVKNEQGVKVFRFQIAATIPDKHGKMQHGIATVDISEVKTEVVEDGNPGSE